MEKKGNVYGVEGLDGTGKTSVAKLLAEQTESRYYYWMESNSMKRWRKYFDNAPRNLRFLYYDLAAIDTYFRVENMKVGSDVFVDRTMASTIAYHIALGVNNAWLSLVPRCTLDQLDRLIYLTATEDTRIERMHKRSIEGIQMTEADKKSLVIGRRVDAAYRNIIPNRTLIVGTDNRTQQEVVDDVKGLLYAR